MSGTPPGTLTGTVVNTQGKALPGAIVTLQGVPQVQVSNHDGEFRFLELPVGSYTVEAQLEGFQTVVDPDVEIYSLQTTQIQLTMQPD